MILRFVSPRERDADAFEVGSEGLEITPVIWNLAALLTAGIT
jgi:hypothetical protein